MRWRASLQGDPRYDTLDEFEAHSQVKLPLACDRMHEAFGRRHGIKRFFVDCEPEGDVVWVWVEERGPTIGLYISVVSRFLTEDEVASGVRPPNPNPYRIVLRLDSHAVTWEEEQRIRTAIAAAFECPLATASPKQAKPDAVPARCTCGAPSSLTALPPAWRTDTVISLARQMSEARDFSAMPILADALQDAGCDNEDILNHCRGSGPHVCGCWVVDWGLGKE